MPTPIELTLTSLLPTISFIPTDLIALSTSLLAQSRHKAPALKAEEEIARTYACCHIACERLGSKLALDIAQPRPPVKPRVYERLRQYLNAVLKAEKTGRGPAKGRRNVSAGADGWNGGAMGTPTRDVTATPTRGVAITPTAARKSMEEENISGMSSFKTMLPGFIRPLVRHICAACGMAQASLYAVEGVSCLWPAPSTVDTGHLLNTPSKRRKMGAGGKHAHGSAGDSDISRVTALVVAICAHTIAKMQGLRLNDKAADSLWDDAAGSLNSYVSANECIAPTMPTDEQVAGDIRFFKQETAQTEWVEMEWYKNVPDPETTGDVDAAINSAQADMESTPVKRPSKTPLRRKEKHGKRFTEEDDDDPGPAGLLPGLATMFQPAVDWLSVERRTEYARWKKGILQELTIVQQQT